MVPSHTTSRRRMPWTIALGGMLLLAVAAAGWRFWPKSDATSDRPLVLVVSADTAGFIIPCGCTSNQSGGLPRRAAYVELLREAADVLVLDAGGAPGGTSEYDATKFAAILQGELRMGLAAHNIGRGEAALGAERLRQFASQTKAPLVSTNLSDADGRALADPLLIVPHAGRKIAVLGVLSPKLTPPGLRAADPREALLTAIAQAKKEHGPLAAVVVLAYLPPDELSALAESLPEADVIVGGPTGQSIAPRQVGPALLAAATNKGKFIAHLEAPPADQGRWSGKIVELTGELADDPQQSSNLHDFYAVLAEKDYSALDTAFVAARGQSLPADYRVAGTAECRRCHQDDHDSWHGTTHGHAWKTLAGRGAHVDSYCQQCHTTGFGLPGGFVSAKRSAARADVGCESCHGPSLAHARQPETRTAFFGQARGQCTTCHDRENSPEFDYDSYWERIAHGSAANPPTGVSAGTGRRDENGDPP